MSTTLFKKNNLKVSKITTHNYSTSFSMGVRILSKKYRDAIYAIYGFVRYADEIVDTFFEYPQEDLFKEFVEETYKAIDRGISMNPILDSFQWAVNTYGIEKEHIDTFLKSMEMDLHMQKYNQYEISEYIDGSAEVVGLMCLRVFYYDDDESYEKLKKPARKLGEAFQKVNFLRDIKSDYVERGRTYFPEIITEDLNEHNKKKIEETISMDFKEAFMGIRALRKEARLGVYLAYIYYLELFKRIQKVKPEQLFQKRHSVPNTIKAWLLFKAFVANRTNIL